MPAKTWPRNTAPMIEGNRRRWERFKLDKAKALLAEVDPELAAALAREILESHGYRVIEPLPTETVKTDVS